MKATASKSQVDRSHISLSFDTILMVSLLLFAGILAIVGGVATSTLFFGILLLFGVFLKMIRPSFTRNEDAEP